MNILKKHKFGPVDFIIYVILGIIAVSTIFPVINTFAISLSNSSKASSNLITFFPIGFNVESYKNILSERNFFNAFYISIKRILFSTTLVFIISVLSAYPLSKDQKKFKLRNFYIWMILITMMFSAPLIPSYINIRNLHLIGSVWALVLPSVVNQFLLILVLNFFRSLPKELDECAGIDGAGPWRKLFQIYLPLSIPILATIILFNIVFHWNAFIDGLIYTNRTEQYPLQTYIQQLAVNFNPATALTTDNDTSRLASLISTRTLNASKLVVTMLPILIIYPFLQRYFITGIMLGSVKE